MKPLLLLLFAAAAAANPKLDEGLDGNDMMPVFVRMESQLFRRAGDYEAFCRKHDADPRGELRKKVTAQLRRNSDEAWKAVQTLVRELEEIGQVRNTLRYWIVNGFACEANAEARNKLAAHPAVSFVYLQRLRNIPLHRRPTGPATPEQQKAVYKNVLAAWRDDGGDPVLIDGVEIPWNVTRVKAEQAWVQEKATGKGVVVALCDSGLMVTPSLMAGLWRNLGEELNGKDDDGNGYTDDLFGYDFGADSWYTLGDGPWMTHGSMCGGIIGGRPSNKKELITGIAPRSRLMVLRGMGYLKAYEYALVNGADVMSMSYMWPGIELGHYRGLYRLAHEHLSAGGVLSVGGAGNFGAGPQAQPKGKQIALPKDIPCVIAASGIAEDGSLPEFSSRGPCFWDTVRFYGDYPKAKPLDKPDVSGCIGGYPVWGRLAMVRRAGWKLVSDEGNGIGLVTGPQGNSFSGPHAAGVAALMLSVNPDLNPWQVKKLMEQSCQDLGPGGRDPQYGSGLLDALAAVRAAKMARR